jgi:hypothetical protein
MDSVKVVCVRNKEYDVLTLVFNIVADYAQNLESWESQGGHGPASIDYVEHCEIVPADQAQDYLDSYTRLYDVGDTKYELVSQSDFINEYFEG